MKDCVEVYGKVYVFVISGFLQTSLMGLCRQRP